MYATMVYSEICSLKWTSIAFIPSSKVFTCYCRDSYQYNNFVNGEGTLIVLGL
jgi:hypothetical protein